MQTRRLSGPPSQRFASYFWRGAKASFLGNVALQRAALHRDSITAAAANGMAPAVPTGFATMRHYERWRSDAERSVDALLQRRAFADAVRALRDLAGGGAGVGGPTWSADPTAVEIGQQGRQVTVEAAMLIPATTQDIMPHVEAAVALNHPADLLREGAALAPSLLVATQRLASWGPEAPRVRRERMHSLQAIFASLEPLSAELRARIGPQHIRCAHMQPMHGAAWACVAAAFGGDRLLAYDAVLGVRPWGTIPASGAYPAKEDPATAECDSLNHDEWNQYLVDSLSERAAAAEAAQGDSWANLQSVFASTVREIDEGLMDGFMSKAQLDQRYGRGCWRAMRRFGV